MDNADDDQNRIATIIDPSNIYLYFKGSDQPENVHAPPTYVGFIVTPDPIQPDNKGDESSDSASSSDQGKIQISQDWPPRTHKRGRQRKRAIEKVMEAHKAEAEADEKADPAQGALQKAQVHHYHPF